MKIAVIIGGASGIGKALAMAFVHEGFDVYIGDVTVVDDTSQKTFNVDAADPDSVNSFCVRLSSQITKIDALVITIGGIDDGGILNVPVQKWEWMLDVNLLGTALLVEAFLPLIQNSDKGGILLTGSGAGFGEFERGSKLGLYSICKHAHFAYFKVLRKELQERNIQVSLLLPSAIKGNLAKNSAQMREKALNEEFAEKGNQPEGRILIDPNVVAADFVSQFLVGRVVITNQPMQMLKRIEDELNQFREYLAPGGV